MSNALRRDVRKAIPWNPREVLAVEHDHPQIPQGEFPSGDTSVRPCRTDHTSPAKTISTAELLTGNRATHHVVDKLNPRPSSRDFKRKVYFSETAPPPVCSCAGQCPSAERVIVPGRECSAGGSLRERHIARYALEQARASAISPFLEDVS